MNQNICHYAGCKNQHKTKINAIYCKTHYLANKQTTDILNNIFSEKGISNIIISIKNEMERNPVCDICTEERDELYQCMGCSNKFCNHGYGDCGIPNHRGKDMCVNCGDCIRCGYRRKTCKKCNKKYCNKKFCDAQDHICN